MADYTLKEQIDTQLVGQIADRITTVYPDFAHDDFINAVDAELHTLELKPRFGLIADKLHVYLPDDYPTAVQIFEDILDETTHDFDHIEDIGFRLLSIPTYVENYGVDYFDDSMNAMYTITRYTSCEFAIRPFIMRYPDKALQTLHEWVHDDNEHVRRLVSEGSRPRLPWAPQLPDFIADPSPTLALLEHLKDDPSLYVRRSVANHLNDITKDHADVVMETLETWQDSASEGTQWLINHALRTLVKKGNPRALRILGYGSAHVELERLEIAPQQLIFGDTLNIGFTLTSTSENTQNLMIDYIMHFVKANGRTAPKVFKLKKTAIRPDESLYVQKTHSIRPISTRKYYPGINRVEIQVNGKVIGEATFELLMPEQS